jgi:hypothetical protein
MWEEFANFYTLIYSTITLLEHAYNSKLTTLFGFLECVQEKEMHTISWARMHIAKFMEDRIEKTLTIMNLNVLQN